MRKTTTALLASLMVATAHAADGPARSAYFGDTHIHTVYSMDAFMAGGVRTTPDHAYNYAKGEAIRTRTARCSASPARRSTSSW